MKVYLLRHGETEWNKLGKFQGQVDVPLNDYGREIADLTRQGLSNIHWDCVFSSPLSRAVETAQIVTADHPVRIETDDRLKEICFGVHEGSPVRTVVSDTDHPLNHFLTCPDRYLPTEGAESIQAAMSRVRSFIDEKVLPLESTCQYVLVTMHGALMRALVAAYGYKKVADYWKISYPNCAVTILDVTNGRIRMDEEAKIFYQLDPDRFQIKSPQKK